MSSSFGSDIQKKLHSSVSEVDRVCLAIFSNCFMIAIS